VKKTRNASLPATLSPRIGQDIEKMMDLIFDPKALSWAMG
jgi:hypothetical protein